MIDKEKFIENIQNLLNAGQTEKEVSEYIQIIGFSEKEATQFMAEVQKGKSQMTKNLMKIIPGTMEDHLKTIATQKKDTKKVMFKENIEEIAKIMENIKQDNESKKE